MGLLTSLVSSGIGSAISGVLAPVLGYFTTKNNNDLGGFQAGVAADTQVQIASIGANVQMAQIRASQNMWWGARLIVLATAGSVAAHFSAVVLDSTPLFHHVVGSWAVAKLPAPYDAYEADILLSFFVLTPAAPFLSAAATWLHRK